MNAFEQARTVEAKAMAVILPFVKERAHDGQYIVTSKGRLAPYLQEVVGDLAFNSDRETVWTVEVKAERRHTGNLFLELWSNRNLDDRQSHAMRGSNPGWMVKLRADLLFYYFLDTDQLYIFDFFRLKRWAFGYADRQPRLPSFGLKRQAAYDQANDTCGHIVSLDVLHREVGYRLVYPKQLPLLPDEAAA